MCCRSIPEQVVIIQQACHAHAVYRAAVFEALRHLIGNGMQAGQEVTQRESSLLYKANECTHGVVLCKTCALSCLFILVGLAGRCNKRTCTFPVSKSVTREAAAQ